MREVICINIGQCGVQMANSAWELFCIEHGIEANGHLKLNLIEDDSTSFKTFFEESSVKNLFVPRSMSVDLEPTVIDEVRKGSYRNLFRPDCLISGLEDGANNFARGQFTIGKTKLPLVKEVLRKLVEACDMLQGFFVLHSCGGGTGSGFATLMLENLALDYAKRTKFQMHVFLSPMLSTAIVEPYNNTLCTSKTITTCDLSQLMDNEALYEICKTNLEIPRPFYSNINRLIARLFSDLTVSLRFESSLNSDLDQLSTNLIPYPRIHYPISGYSPINSHNRALHELWTVTQLTRDVFDSSNRFATCNTEKGRYMSCVLQYRGDVSHQQVNSAIIHIKKQKRIRFVSWSPTGFKIGINCQPPATVTGTMASSTRSATMLYNTTAAKDCIRSLEKRFDILFSKRSFIHWFVGEGMEEGEFNESRDEVSGLVRDFEEIEEVEVEEDEEEEEREKNEKAAKYANGTNDDNKKIIDDFEGEQPFLEDKEEHPFHGDNVENQFSQ